MSAVDILPVGTTTIDPNHGLWFVYKTAAGGVAHGVAQLVNPADVAQTVTVYPRELDFTDDATPTVSTDPAAGIGSWVRFGTTRVTVPPQQRVRVPFVVHVPANAEPGDHTGVLVAESAVADVGGRFHIVKRIATRFYVTVPGQVVVAYRLTHLQHHVDNVIFPGGESVQVNLENTGTTRVDPVVTVNGQPAIGARTVMSRSVEPFQAAVKVPWYGGPVHIRIVATAPGAPPQVLTKTVWVIPWALIAMVVVGLVGLVHVVRFWRGQRRRRQTARAARLAEEAALRARLAELEAVVTAGAGDRVPSA